MHRKPAFHGTRPLMAVALACAACAAHSVENGAPITPIGVYHFGAGTLPPSSLSATVGLRGATEQRQNPNHTHESPHLIHP